MRDPRLGVDQLTTVSRQASHAGTQGTAGTGTNQQILRGRRGEVGVVRLMWLVGVH